MLWRTAKGPAECVGNDVVHALDVRDGQVVLKDVMQPMREWGGSSGSLRLKGSGKALVVSVKVDGNRSPQQVPPVLEGKMDCTYLNVSGRPRFGWGPKVGEKLHRCEFASGRMLLE